MVVQGRCADADLGGPAAPYLLGAALPASLTVFAVIVAPPEVAVAELSATG